MSPDVAFQLTLRQLVLIYDTRLIDEWDHTASVTSIIQNLAALVNNLLVKKKIQPVTNMQAHPYRNGKKKSGMEITPQNFRSLRPMLSSLGRGGGRTR